MNNYTLFRILDPENLADPWLSSGACLEAPSPCCRASRLRHRRIGSYSRHRRRRFSQRSCRGPWGDYSHRGRSADPAVSGPSLLCSAQFLARSPWRPWFLVSDSRIPFSYTVFCCCPLEPRLLPVPAVATSLLSRHPCCFLRPCF
jgi:hypothetical protein